MCESKKKSGILIYGGSFNPIHIGHLRLAIEARECLRNFLHRLEFVPTACHPQKEDKGLLPFPLRVKLIQKAIARLPDAACNELEEKRRGPSFTLDTLREYCRQHDKSDLYFLIGSEDFRLLPTWHKGMEIIDYCNLAVAPRGAFSKSEFVGITRTFWPSAAPDPEAGRKLALDGGMCLKTDKRSRIFYLSIPYLEISASRIRELWLRDLNIDFLVPESDIEILDREKIQVRQSWLKKE